MVPRPKDRKLRTWQAITLKLWSPRRAEMDSDARPSVEPPEETMASMGGGSEEKS